MTIGRTTLDNPRVTEDGLPGKLEGGRVDAAEDGRDGLALPGLSVIDNRELLLAGNFGSVGPRTEGSRIQRTDHRVDSGKKIRTHERSWWGVIL